MSSQTSLVAVQVRLQRWTEQIRDCQNRPADMKVEDWCEQHGITKASYYYRLRRVREACLNACGGTAFVEMPAIASSISAQPVQSETKRYNTAAILHISGGVSLEIQNSASADFLTKLIGVVSHAQ